MHLKHALAAAALGALLIPLTGAAAQADGNPITTTGLVRLAGADRYATAVKVSQKTFKAPQSYVVIASGENWPDALAAGPLAAHIDAPVLLVKRSGVPSVVDAELKRLGAVHVLVVGGPAAIPDTVMRAATRWSNDAKRLAGPDRYATAEAVAAEMGAVPSVYVSSGATYADALAGGAAAAAEGGALVLSSPTSLSSAASRVLAKKKPGHVVLLGGTGALSAQVERQVKAVAPAATVDRAAGQDRYDTAAILADALWGGTGPGAGADAVFYASGTSFPDALAATPAAYVNDAPVLLTRGTCTPKPTAFVENELAPSLGVFLGGSTVTYSGTRVC
jgi:putative cell wall-binding protein